MNDAAAFQADPAIPPDLLKEFGEKIMDPHWRITSGNLYKIIKRNENDPNDEGLIVPFIPNRHQRRFLNKFWHRNVILKARQLGFTTLACILMLDHALFNADQRCLFIAHDIDSAKRIFRDKIKFAYENLPGFLRAAFPLMRKAAAELLFAHNNSSIQVDTSGRSGTFNMVHISEYGKIAAKYPDKAEEIKTGTFPSVSGSDVITIESTAEGAAGQFYDLATLAEQRAADQRPLHNKEWRFHFFPWWENPEYSVPPKGVALSPQQHQYFDGIEAKFGVKIRLGQRAWYGLTLEQEMFGDQAMMWREYPSSSEEAFQQAIEGAYYAKQLTTARKQGRITRIPFVTHVQINTFWDIGKRDGTGIWLHQYIHPEHRLLRYVEGWGEGYGYYIQQLEEIRAEGGEGFVWGTHYLPHDATHQRQMVDRVCSPLELLEEHMPHWTFEIVPQVQQLMQGINATRELFPLLWFDEEGCKEGLEKLARYRKKWNDRVGGWMEEPVKDDTTEAADAIRQLAQGVERVVGNARGGRQQVPKRHGARRRVA